MLNGFETTRCTLTMLVLCNRQIGRLYTMLDLVDTFMC